MPVLFFFVIFLFAVFIAFLIYAAEAEGIIFTGFFFPVNRLYHLPGNFILIFFVYDFSLAVLIICY